MASFQKDTKTLTALGAILGLTELAPNGGRLRPMPEKPRSAEYFIWGSMIQRCCNPKNKKYSTYGAKGITVCPQWRQSFKCFLADMGRRPSPKYSLERVNNGLGYGPDNCKWATASEQNRNNNRNHFIEWRGERKCLTDWAKELGLSTRTISNRLRLGWTYEQALGTPRLWRGKNQHTKVSNAKSS